MSHRKVDVDFDDDDFEDDVLGTSTPSISAAEAESAANSRAQEVRALLRRGNTVEAIKKSLDNPPLGKDHQQAKDRNTQTVMEALLSVKSNDMAPIVQSLSSDELDVLMKYIYKGMAFPEVFNSSTLLSWHEKTLEVSGLGSIVRVMSDQRTV